jgi:hypothetical protein
MGNKGLQRLAILTKKNADHNWVNVDLYRLLYLPEMYRVAWIGRQRRRGVAPNTKWSAVDNETYSSEYLESAIESIIKSMRDQSFRLGGEDVAFDRLREMLVREVLALILGAIYENPKNPTFLTSAYGWRPERSAHHALRALRTWKGVHWFVEGHLQGELNITQKTTLIKALRRRLKDGRFLDLLRKMLTLDTIQFDVLSPDSLNAILLGVFFHELDCFIEDAGKALLNRESDPHSLDIRQLRYGPEWRLGVVGPRRLAEAMSYDISNRLVNEVDTVVSLRLRHACSEGTFFLSTNIRALSSKGATRLKLDAPVKQIVVRLSKLGFCLMEGDPTPRSSWAHLKLDQIILRYNRILRGYLDYYRFVDNRRELRRIQYILQHSAARTFAQKLKLSVRKVFARFGSRLRVVDATGREQSLKLNSDWKARSSRFLITTDRRSPDLNPKFAPHC